MKATLLVALSILVGFGVDAQIRFKSGENVMLSDIRVRVGENVMLSDIRLRLIAVKANGVENPLIWLSVNADGGFAQFNNKSGGTVAKIYAEANGSGVIGAFDGKGKEGKGSVIRPN
jgi:hypothetical protein